MKARWMFFLLCLLLMAAAAPAPAAGPLVELEGKYEDIAQDGGEMVWAIPQNTLGEIATLEGNRWVKHTLVDLDGHGRAVVLETMANGEVMSLWNDREEADKWYYARHRDGKSKPAGTFRSRLTKPRLWPAADGGALLTESGPAVIHFGADYGAPEIVQMGDNLFFKHSGVYPPRAQPYEEVHAVEDARHGWWLWTSEMVIRTAPVRIRCMVHFTKAGEPFTNVMARTPGNSPSISGIVPWDEKTLAVVLNGHGLMLYALDPTDNPWAPVPEPEPKAFKYIEKIFRAGGDLYVVATNEPHEPLAGREDNVIRGHFQDYPGDVLWRLHEGKWEAVERKLDVVLRFGVERAWAVNADGVALSSQQNAPWMFPAKAGEAPFHLTAEMSFPLRELKRICAVDAGHMMFLGQAGETWLWSTNARPDNVPKPSFDRVPTRGNMWVDSRGHVWCIHADLTYGEWDGEKWTIRPLPPDIKKAFSYRSSFWADDRDQGWFVYYGAGPVGVLDFRNSQWHLYETEAAALETQLPRGVKIQFLSHHAKYAPAFSGDGRIAMFSDYDKITIFEKGQWRWWSTSVICGNEAIETPLFFSKTGALSLTTMLSLYELRETGWKRIREVTPPEGRLPGDEGPVLDLGPGKGQRQFPFQTAVKDRFGTVWSLEGGKELRKFVRGHDVAVFQPGELQPFAERPMLAAVLLDNRGGAFLDTDRYQPDHDIYVHIPPRLPMPHTEVKLVEIKDDSVKLKLANTSGGETWFTWRLDNGYWSPVQTTADLSIQLLPQGDHRVEARAYNAALEPDLQTAAATFHIQTPTATVVDRFITQIDGAEPNQREAIARRLEDSGAAILPQLKAAREKAGTSSTAQWWLEAVMQEIERREKKKGN